MAAWVAVLAALAVLVGGASLAPTAASAAEPVPTTTALAVQGGTHGEETLLTAMVTSDAGVPTGSVQFLDGTTPLGAPVPVDASGRAVLTITAVAGFQEFAAAFTGTGDYADSAAPPQLHVTPASGTVLDPEPTLLAPGPRLTLTMAAHVHSPSGRPVVGETLIFSVFGKQPNPFDFGGGLVVCEAVTDAHGYASCAARGTFGSVLSLLAGRSYVTHYRTAGYGFSSAIAPVIKLG